MKQRDLQGGDQRAGAMICVLALFLSVPLWAADESIDFARFGAVRVFRHDPHPARVAILVSDADGWTKQATELAERLAAGNLMVAGVDLREYLQRNEKSNEKTPYAAAHFEALSQSLQKRLGFPAYHPPVLVGVGGGAGGTLVYAVLAESPANTFLGALSLGFCPAMTLGKPLRKQNHLDWEPGRRAHEVVFKPASRLEGRWTVLAAGHEGPCRSAEVFAFARQVPSTQVLRVRKRELWTRMEAALTSFFPLSAPPPPAVDLSGAPPVDDLPLVVLPAQGASDGPSLAVIISGDGGWASLDKEIGGALAAHGVPVVGFNSLQYFWRARTPDGAATDLARVLRHYLAAWKKDGAVLIGYSSGADVLPFMVNRLPADLRSRVGLVALLGPSLTANFEFHVTEWLGASGDDEKPVRPEVERLRGAKILCFFGEEEKETLCKQLDPALALRIGSPGAHHFGGDYEGLAKRILDEMGNEGR